MSTGNSPLAQDTQTTAAADVTPLVELRGISKSLRAGAGPDRRRSRSLPGAGDRARRGQRGGQIGHDQDDLGPVATGRGRDPVGRQAGAPPQPQGRRGPRHHDDLPGPRAVRQPGHRAEHVPRTRGHATRPARRGDDGDRRARRRSRSSQSPRFARSASPSPRCPAGSASPSPWPRRVMSKAKLVIMDEPTAALGVAQTRQVLDLIKRLAGQRRRRPGRLAQPQRRLPGRRPDRRPLSRPPASRPARHRTSTARATVDYMTTGRSSRAPGANDRRDLAGGLTWTRPARPPPTTGDRDRAGEPRRRGGGRSDRGGRSWRPRPSAPEVLATSFGEYVQAWKQRIRSGDSGALPIVVGLVIIVIIFQVERSEFLSASNIVNLLVQAAVFVLLGAGRDLRPDPLGDRPVDRLRRRRGRRSSSPSSSRRRSTCRGGPASSAGLPPRAPSASSRAR